jgi:DNA-directed RNA polymerase subunit K/omega
MDDSPDFISETVPDSEAAADLVAPPEVPEAPLEPAVPITSRFLYVDVAAMRAKQLRRGARLRYDMEPGVPAPKKPERQAMEEVRRCLVQYTIPVWKGVGKSDEEA